MTERKCVTPGCGRKARNSGSDGKTLHAHCETCERVLMTKSFGPKEK